MDLRKAFNYETSGNKCFQKWEYHSFFREEIS